MKANYGSPIVGNGKNKGMQFDAIENGIKTVEFGGRPSIPLQGGEILNGTQWKKSTRVVQSNPGFMRLTFTPILGSVAGQSTLASLEEMGEAFWRSIRSATPHAENYQPGDVITVIDIAAGLRYGVSWLRSLIKSLVYGLGKNTYVNDGIWRMYLNAPASAEITDYSGLVPTLLNLYKSITKRMNTVPIPDVFPIFHRWEYMAGTIFRDHKDEEKAQYIIFSPSHYYDWELSEPENPGTRLIPKSIYTEDPVQFAKDLFAVAKHVTSDSSMSQMFSDLVLTYPETQCLTWETELTQEQLEKEGFSSVFDVDILYAIHNAQLCNINAPTWFVHPKTGTIDGTVVAPQGKRSIGFVPPICNAVIDDDIDTKRFTLMTQWVLFTTDMHYDTASEAVYLVNTPLEVLTGYRLYYWKWNSLTRDRELASMGATDNSTTHYGSVPADTNPVVTVPILWYERVSALLSFAWAPMQRVHWVNLGTESADSATQENITESNELGEFVELERPFEVDPKMVTDAHNAMRMGGWNIPQNIFNGKRNGNK